MDLVRKIHSTFLARDYFLSTVQDVYEETSRPHTAAAVVYTLEYMLQVVNVNAIG